MGYCHRKGGGMMKLKEISTGMVISWKTQDEKVALLEELECLGYKWYGTERKPTEACDDNDTGHAIYVYNDNGYKNITHSNNMEEVTHNFSDIIIPELELSAEDALLAYDQMCRENYCCNDCPIYGIVGCECTHEMDGHISEIVDAIKRWKAEREKKEPEIEWFWKSYVVGGSDYKESDTEQEAMEWCEYYAKEHPEAKCTYKHVCRVKAVE